MEFLLTEKEKLQEPYIALVEQLVKRADASEVCLKELGFDYLKTPYPARFEKEKTLLYCQALSAYGYKSQYADPEHVEFSIDLKKLLAVCEKIDNDLKIAFVNKRNLVFYIDSFFEMRVYLKFLNKYFPGKYNRNKEGNTLYLGLHHLLSRIAEEQPAFLVRGASREFISDDVLKAPEFILMKYVVAPNEKETGEPSADFARLLKIFSVPEIRKLERYILSSLYSAIVTVNDLEDLTPDTLFNFSTSHVSSIKADLLFDFLPILFPNRVFLTASQVSEMHLSNRNGGFYEGSYFRYRKDTTLSILGKSDLLSPLL